MYSVSATVGGVTMWLHDDTVSNSSVKLIDPVLTLEDSAAGSFTFKLAPNNIGYTQVTVTEDMVASVDGSGNITMETVGTDIDLVERMRSTIKVYRDGTEIWEGRVLSEDRDFQNLRDIYCEGELSYLNDVCMPQRRYDSTQQVPLTNFQFLKYVLDYYNTKAADNRKIYIGTVTVHAGDGDNLGTRITNMETCLEVVNKLVEEYGGHLRIRKNLGVRQLDWLEDYPNVSTQTIEFGSNLLDFTRNWDMSDLCTVVLPTGEVVEEANKSTVGDEVTPVRKNTGHLLYVNTDLNPNDAREKTDNRLTQYTVAEYNVTPSTAEHDSNYYVSCRLHRGLVAYWIKQSGGVTETYKTVGSDDDIRFTDMLDEKVKIPIGCNKILICGYGNDIPVCLKAETVPPEDYDKYLTIEQCATDVDSSGKCWHQKGSAYVSNPELVSKYGWIEKHITFSDISDKDQLYTSAKQYLTADQYDKMKIEVTALDLHILNVDTDAIQLLDMVRIVSAPHDINGLDMPVTKIEIPLDRPQDQKFTIGSESERTLTSVNNDIDADLMAKIAAVPTMSKMLDAAQQNAANMILSATGGYINIVDTDGDGHTDALIVSDVENPSSSNPGHNCWIFNKNGLGHFDGYPLDPSVIPEPIETNAAITMDGRIVANYITSGVLSTIQINGCNATFGGHDNRSGVLKVKSVTAATSQTPAYCTVLKDGGVFFGTEDVNGTVTDFANIRDNKSYQVSGQSWPGLVITTGDYGNNKPGVLALDIDQLWISEHSSGGPDTMKTRGGLNQVFSFKDGDGNTQQMRFVHGILTEIITTPPPPEPEEEET